MQPTKSTNWYVNAAILSLLHLVLIASASAPKAPPLPPPSPPQPPSPTDTIVVRTSDGRIRGARFHTIFEHHPALAFRGIPYARPPVGRRRFLPPLPALPWRGIRDCRHFGPVCPQFDPLQKGRLIGSEDCLSLNVYTRQLQPSRRKAVMVYIHGGGWYFGSGNDDLQGPDLLLNEDVVLVTLNYRIGVLGFMSLGTPEYSGNQGLKDQQCALRWVQRNIHRFGGDRRRVTLFGQSAGSTSAYFHMLAPGSRGLMQQTIQMSFTFDIWAVSERGDQLGEMYWLARKGGRRCRGYGDLVHFLQSTDGLVFTKSFPIKQFDPSQVPIRIFSKWLPVVENSLALQPFLQHPPEDLLFSGNFARNVNVMTGYTSAEALFYVSHDTEHPSDLNAFNANFQIELPSRFFTKNYDSAAYKLAAQRIRSKYFSRPGIAVNHDWHTLQQFVKLMSDVYENFPIDRRVKLLAASSRANIYYYNFALESQLNYYKVLLGAEGQYGASHADDICYVFYCRNIEQRYANVTRESLEHVLIRRMTGLYTNYAKFSVPLPSQQDVQWRPVQTDRVWYLNIGMNGLSVGLDPLAEEMQFWHDLLADNTELMSYNVTRFVDRVLKKYKLYKK